MTGVRLRSLGFIKHSVTAATALTAGASLGAGKLDVARFTVETNPIRMRSDGTAPDASTGVLHPISLGEPYEITTPARAQFIPTTGTSVVNVEFFEIIG